MTETFTEKRARTAKRLNLGADVLPRHIAIIMDGNGRWATGKGLPRFQGHQQGGKAVEKIADYAVHIGIEYLTLYSFSMQNWKRPAEEIDFLMHLYKIYLEGIRPKLMENNARLVHLGLTERLPKPVIDALNETVRLTSSNTGMVLGLALNYDSRSEITAAVRKIAQEYKAGILADNDINEECFSNHLYTAGWPDPDLLIRTSGEMRISNFMLWQLSYTEFYITEALWPDFCEQDLDRAIIAYAQRARRFGDITTRSTACGQRKQTYTL